MKSAIFFFLCFSCCSMLIACDASTKPYIQNELSYKKLGNDCSGKTGSFNMNSNTNGERYVIQECVDADFDKSKLLVDRKGDTVVIGFKSSGQQKALFELTIDVDTYPAYHFLTIGENTYTVVPAQN
jgi:hypothetical protein